PRAKLVRKRRPIYLSQEKLSLQIEAARRLQGVARSVASIPIVHHGLVVAALNLSSRQCDSFSPAMKKAVEALAAQTGGFIARLRLEEKLRSSRDNWQTLFNFVDDFLFILDKEGRIIMANQAVTRRLGLRLTQLIGRPVLNVHPPGRRKEAAKRVARMLAGIERICCIPLQTRNGTLIPVETKITRGQWEGQDVWIGISRDITETQRVADALRDSEEKYRLVTELAFDRISLTTADDFRYVFINRAGAESLGYSVKQVVGHCVTDFIHPDDAADFKEFKKTMFKQGRILFELRYKKKDRSFCWLETNGRLIHDSKGQELALFVSRDITERRQQLLIKAAEAEQRRIGQDLHDGMGQHLAGIQMLAHLLLERLKKEGQASNVKLASEIDQLLAQALSQNAGIARGLLPVPKTRGGLCYALGEMAETVSRLFGVKCIFRNDQPVDLSDNTRATHLYRIAQEAVSNAIRHGKAKHIDVFLRQTGHKIILNIKDDGEGISLARRDIRGLGLHVMDYRAKQMDGLLDISNNPAGGVTVSCVVPMRGGGARRSVGVR
ncbi:MAG: PAS domain S-box protein, partial [Lentisphaerota bacterium]